jgi:S1-C subfamily serine protease
MAIGTPFGLDRTVTVGIISATGRSHLGVTTYESFIQTDAAINPGNSGGPLVDLQGRVIGITTAVVAAGQGIGFAIPVDMVKDVMRQIIERGRVVRGWIGVSIQEVDEALAPWFGVPPHDGALVAGVAEGAPAEAAGLLPGDVIVAFGGARIRGVEDFQRRATAMPPGARAEVTVIRDGAPVTMTVTVSEMPGEEPAVEARQPDERWGLTVEPLSIEEAWRSDLPVTSGLAVTRVRIESPAARAGLRRGDILLEVNGHPVPDVEALSRELEAVPAGGAVPVHVYRGSSDLKAYVALERPAEP